MRVESSNVATAVGANLGSVNLYPGSAVGDWVQQAMTLHWRLFSNAVVRRNRMTFPSSTYLRDDTVLLITSEKCSQNERSIFFWEIERFLEHEQPRLTSNIQRHI